MTNAQTVVVQLNCQSYAADRVRTALTRTGARFEEMPVVPLATTRIFHALVAPVMVPVLRLLPAVVQVIG